MEPACVFRPLNISYASVRSDSCSCHHFFIINQSGSGKSFLFLARQMRKWEELGEGEEGLG